jgi:hypothetical protein
MSTASKYVLHCAPPDYATVLVGKRYEEEKYPLILPRIKPRFLGRSAHSLVAILNDLSRLPMLLSVAKLYSVER